MNRIYLVLLILLTVLSGCAESSVLSKTAGSGIRGEIFQESASGSVAPGYAELRVVASLKTHRPGIYPFEANSHGTPGYTMLVEIDGQAVEIAGDLHEENRPTSVMQDPEAGTGVRFRFTHKFRLKAGSHKIRLAFPADDLALERIVDLTGKSAGTLLVQPVYRALAGKQRPGFYGVTSFKEGLTGLRLSLDGKEI